MKVFKKNYKKLLIIALICFFQQVNAQSDPSLPTNGDVKDNPAAPISGLIPLAALVGAGIGFFKLKNKN